MAFPDLLLLLPSPHTLTLGRYFTFLRGLYLRLGTVSTVIQIKLNLLESDAILCGRVALAAAIGPTVV